ncbi:MAG TPA: choice-of-anchor Q domain-containing protein, partial [Anaerolineae bacterium]
TLSFFRWSVFALALIFTLASATPVMANASVVDSGEILLTAPASETPLPLAPATPSSFAWYNGRTDYSTIINCASIIQGFPYQEYGAGAYVGYVADLNAGKPAPNDIYYIHVVIGAVGNSCSGMRAYLDFTLPANTSLATGSPIYCFYNGAPISPCPQSLPLSPYHIGAYAIPSSDTSTGGTWPLQQGRILEFQIPVKSSTALSNSTLQANVFVLDGNSSPWLLAQQGVYVFSGSPTLPSISYPAPSTISETTTSAHSMAYLFTYGAGGTGYFDLGTTASYGLIHEMVPIAAGYSAWVAYDDWGPPALTPDTDYHWRFIFTPTGGSTVYGADQTFHTLPDGRVTIGTGLPGACTEAALNSALAVAKDIRFNCGSMPITITLTGAKLINTDVTIEGGHKVTLSSGVAQGHFRVLSGGKLTLVQLALVNGTADVGLGGCGGSVYVAGYGQLFINESLLFNNHAASSGGALCIDPDGYARIYYSQFLQNSAVGSGGAIYDAGAADMLLSDLSSNSSQSYGGGIYVSGGMTVTYSLIYGNSAANGSGTGGGGGIYNNGIVSLSTSTVSSNFANFGGGISNDGTSMTLIGLTIANNGADPGSGFFRYTVAGGLQSSPSATNASLRNTLLAGNWPGNCGISAIFRTFSSYGNNLDSQDRCQLRGFNDLYNADPKLGPLQNNGGRTRTHALGASSAAIDTGTNLLCGNIDQRGYPGPTIPGGLPGRQIDGNRDGMRTCDIGAYEYRLQTFLPISLRSN